jgi:transcriptional regulator with XRE-family HTH domain
MSTQPNSAVSKWQLGMALRRRREALGMDQKEPAALLGCSAGKIGTIESGDVGMKPEELVTLLDLYGVDGPEREDLIALGLQSRARRRRTSYGPAIPDWFRRYVHLEEGAVAVKKISDVVPGPLQTEGTARAIMLASPLPSPADVDQLVKARMARQRGPDDPTRMHMVLRQSALRIQIGGPDVHRAQLKHLRELADWPNVTLQIIREEDGADPAMGFVFALLELPNAKDGLDVVYLEDPTSARYIDRDVREQQRYGLIWNALVRFALPPVASAALLDTLIARL